MVRRTVLVDKVEVIRWNVIPPGGPHVSVRYWFRQRIGRRDGLRGPASQHKYRGGSSRGDTAQASWATKDYTDISDMVDVTGFPVWWLLSVAVG